MHKRLNITLPESTIELLEKAAKKGERSELINTAIKEYVSQKQRMKLRRAMIEGAKANAALDLKIAQEWFPLDEEAWEKYGEK
jgi:metal-responsive CopG/Arc/MetJ family transcriptional regulator